VNLTERQRAAPPVNRWAARRGLSMGGVDTTKPLTLHPGLVDDRARYPGTVFDGRIIRDRQPVYDHPRYIPPPLTWVNWTAAGPTRPELHMRNESLRLMVGNSASRYPVIPGSPTGGMHTSMPGPGVTRSIRRYVVTPQMRAGRPDRLAASQYSGQTYSQSTIPQGR
jgi:hypothetical protein